MIFTWLFLCAASCGRDAEPDDSPQESPADDSGCADGPAAEDWMAAWSEVYCSTLFTCPEHGVFTSEQNCIDAHTELGLNPDLYDYHPCPAAECLAGLGDVPECVDRPAMPEACDRVLTPVEE